MPKGDPVASPPAAEPSAHAGHFRWFICGLLFYATTVNYMDRVVLGILKPTISRDLHWTDSDYGQITAVFQFGYALMLPIAGRLIDWLGLRFGYALAVLVWGLSSIAHSFAGNLFQFGLARLGLGLGEAANFPAAIKAVADWFPRKERALATGIFNSGTNVGALIAPLIVPIVVMHFGWHSAFLVTGSISLSWIFVWLLVYREPEAEPRLSAAEFAYIRSDVPEDSTVKIPYLELLKKRAAWAFLVGKFCTDPVWWFYLFWIPGFLSDKYHVDLQHIGPPLVVIYLAADVGSVSGGWLSSALLKRGWDLTRARKTAMLVFACTVLAVALVPFAAGNLWLTVALIGIAAGSHQGWSANLFTMASDCFPRKALASIVGLGGLGGALGGMLAQPAVGKWLDLSHQAYAPLFFIAGCMYLFSLLIIHLLLPRFRQVKF
jgi:ACS family hexuronate transporter-like MFS transporter